MPIHDRTSFESLYDGQPRGISADHSRRASTWPTGSPGRSWTLGAGRGENSLFFARQGQKVTGIDFLVEPIHLTNQKAGRVRPEACRHRGWQQAGAKADPKETPKVEPKDDSEGDGRSGDRKWEILNVFLASLRWESARQRIHQVI